MALPLLFNHTGSHHAKLDHVMPNRAIAGPGARRLLLRTAGTSERRRTASVYTMICIPYR
jgi:hypothetical protein